MAALLSMFTAFLIVKIAQARRRPVTVGVHQLVGEHGRVRHGGFVFLNGELWQARAVDGEPLREGDEVEVADVDGLTLEVRRSAQREELGSAV
jgi:membrane-bound ClpP family serine protease